MTTSSNLSNCHVEKQSHFEWSILENHGNEVAPHIVGPTECWEHIYPRQINKNIMFKYAEYILRNTSYVINNAKTDVYFIHNGIEVTSTRQACVSVSASFTSTTSFKIERHEGISISIGIDYSRGLGFTADNEKYYKLNHTLEIMNASKNKNLPDPSWDWKEQPHIKTGQEATIKRYSLTDIYSTAQVDYEEIFEIRFVTYGHIRYIEPIAEYDIKLMSELNGKEPTEKGKFYVSLDRGVIKYKILSVDGKVKSDNITSDELISHGAAMPLSNELGKFQSIREAILRIASERGHSSGYRGIYCMPDFTFVICEHKK